VPVRHIAVFRWTESTTSEQVAAIAAALGDLPGLVPTLLDYRYGPDLALGEGRWDFGIVATFDDVSGWREYDEHPAHDRVRRDLIAPCVAERAAVQISS
jgi:hypothetical protein